METLNDALQNQTDIIHLYEATWLIFSLSASFALLSLGIWLWRSSGLRKQELDAYREKLRYERTLQKASQSSVDESRSAEQQQDHGAGSDKGERPASARERYYGGDTPYLPK